MGSPDRIAAWRPRLEGVAEVFHAQWHDHAYPAHTHDTWTLLIVDDGLIGYGLDRHEHAAPRGAVTLLPPHVVHDGRSVTSAGFRKRVLYLEETVIPERLIGRAVDAPLIADGYLRDQVSRLDGALVVDEHVEAEARLVLVLERLTWHLAGRPETPAPTPRPGVARTARELFDADPTRSRLADAAAQTGVTPAHLVRAFTAEFGIAPHRYLLGRRLDLARKHLLGGQPPADVATATGFYDQAHLTRHFKRLLSTTPGKYRRSGETTPASPPDGEAQQ
ncbi:AraC family transcriptional regulator [Georgenia halophila]|uniref:AraC family transcriptional regulator n=1 Tax=Georgenia halophila TaxID=620889 RepID=A0ABP8LBN7_9MICO